MNLQHLNNHELLEKTQRAADNERAATTILLHHLNEVARRRLYAEAGYSSLFEYCVRSLRMSEPQAGRRVAAARAMKDFPEIEAKIQMGALSISALNQVQILFKKVELKKEEKKQILEKIEGESSRKIEKILAAYHPEEPKKEKIRVITPTLTELRCTVDNEVMENIERLKELWSHEMLNATLADLLKKMAHYCRDSIDPLKKTGATKSTTTPESQRTKTRYIPANVKKEVILRDKYCTYINAQTGVRCNSRYFLEFDHIIPYAKDGKHTKENLRLRCRAHNQLHAIQQFGEEKILAHRRANTG